MYKKIYSKPLAMLFLLTIMTINVLSSTGLDLKKDSTKVLMTTSLGEIELVLYNETPLHRDNFIKLVNEKFYEGVLFHRVIKNFMIQGGDPESKNATDQQQLGNGGTGYTIPAEFVAEKFHKKGALCAARMGDQVNPQKASSGCQFYIVTGKVASSEELDNLEKQLNLRKENQLINAYLQQSSPEIKAAIQWCQQNRNQDSINVIVDQIKPEALRDYQPVKFSEEAKEAYATVGGTPFLDNDYTVFGEVVKGIEVVEAIGAVATRPGDRPIEDVKVLKIVILD